MNGSEIEPDSWLCAVADMIKDRNKNSVFQVIKLDPQIGLVWLRHKETGETWEFLTRVVK